MRGLPVNGTFAVQVASTETRIAMDISPSSPEARTLEKSLMPTPALNLQVHRTDPRVNMPKHDGSVCVDLHWSHPNPHLDRRPDDVYFRISHHYENEASVEFCQDVMGSMSRACGEPLRSMFSKVPSRFSTICGLRPGRKIHFIIEAFNCDSPHVGENGAATRIVDAFTPTSAPTVITTMVTDAGNQESIAGFRPTVVVDWIPQHFEFIAGHAVYLGLVHISAMKLLCWIPHNHSKFAAGQLELPVVHKNHTRTEDVEMYKQYKSGLHVHQEQEIIVTTRTTADLESPPFSRRLGSWLVIEEAVKCLTSFEAKYPSYAAHPVEVSWTQKQAISVFD